MFLPTEKRSLAKLAAVVALVQGLTWLILCIIALIVSKSPPENINDISSVSYTTYLSRVIYNQFLEGDNNNIISPQNFTALLWIYTILSAFWIAASIDQYAALLRNHRRQAYLCIILGSIILITSVIDAVFTSLLARDFSDCPFSINMDFTLIPSTTTSTDNDITQIGLDTINNFDCKLATGVVMTLVARGYVLWLVNVIMSLALIIVGTQALHSTTLMTYERNTIPRIPVRDEKRNLPYNEGSFYEDKYIPPPFPGTDSSRYSTPVALGKIRNSNNYY